MTETNRSKETISLTAQPVIGTRRKHWQIVNQHGGLVRYFEGTKSQAEAEARRLQRLGCEGRRP